MVIMDRSITKGADSRSSSSPLSSTGDNSNNGSEQSSTPSQHHGMATTVQEFNICRLSFYLKCCTIGCGLAPSIESSLLDYSNAHRLPVRLQHYIFHLCLALFNPERLVDRAYFVDDGHAVLPAHLSNAFFDMDAVAASATIPPELRQVNIFGTMITLKKVMVCTSNWINEYYIRPINDLQGAFRNVNVLKTKNVNVMSTSDEHCARHRTNGFHCSHCLGLPGVPCACDRGCAVSSGGCGCRVVHYGVTCSGCGMAANRGLPGISGTRFRCIECIDCNLCEYCYENGEHDQTHAFQRISHIGAAPELLAARAVLLDEGQSRESHDEIPLAMTVQIETAAPVIP